MKLNEFLNFNRMCPICQEPLHLFMQWTSSVCFKATQLDEHSYGFIPFKGTKRNIGTDGCDDEFVIINDDGSSQFSTSRLEQESKKFQIYFFFLCNPGAGFKDKGVGDYEINLFRACYYRSSPFMEYKQNKDGIWTLENSLEETKEITNNDESFSFKVLSPENDRVYMLNLNYDKQETKLWFYSVPQEERQKPGFRPKLFSKTLPILKNRPDFGIENREKLLDRFDSWIIMS